MDMMKAIKSIDITNKPKPLYDICLGIADAIKAAGGIISENTYLILVGKSNEFYFENSDNKKKEIIAVLAKVISDYDKTPYSFYEIEKHLKKVTGLK